MDYGPGYWPVHIYHDPQVDYAFEHPEEFDWSGDPTRLERAIMNAIEFGSTDLQPWTIYDREVMHDIVNQNKREAIRFQPLLNGSLRITNLGEEL